tara:strand:+ start:2556 stop:2792 length:237 start_codon:yes stop_codon:yes gene_type:complete
MNKKRVIITSYSIDDLEWDSREDYELVKERYGKEPIYFIYKRSWATHNVHSNVPDLYSESGGYDIVRRKCRLDYVLYV